MAFPLFALGNALVDVEYGVTDEFLQQAGLQKGTMQLASQEQQLALTGQLPASPTGRVSGGSAANTAFAYRALGEDAWYCCRVGDDADGYFYLADLNRAGIHTAAAAIEPGMAGTGNCLVLVTPDAERTMQTWLGITSHLGPAQVSLADLGHARLLYIEGYLATSDSARQAVALARAQARLQGAKIALSLSDPAMVQYARNGLLEMMSEGLDYLFCNAREALLFTEVESLEQAAERLHEHARTVIITRGADGAFASDQLTGQTYHLPAAKAAKVVDTNGAGDAYAGAFLYGIARGWTITEAGALAAKISAAVVQQYGPRLPQARYQEILADGTV